MYVALRRAARRSAREVSRNRVGIALRLLFPIALLEIALWAPMPAGVLFGVAALWYITWQLRSATSTLRTLGLDLRCLLRGTWLMATTLAIAVAILATSYFSGSLHRLWGLHHPLYAIAAYAVWAFIQEFMLQCFCMRMLRALVSRISALLLSGVVFAVAHLPNPSLTFVTFFAGVGFTAIYTRKRNLYLVAAMHAVLGLTLSVSAPDTWFHQLRVGRDFLQGQAPLAATLPPQR